MSRILQSFESYGKAVPEHTERTIDDSTDTAYVELRQRCWELAREIAVSKQTVEQYENRKQRHTTMLRLVSSVGGAEDADLEDQILLMLPPEDRPTFTSLLGEYSIYKESIEQAIKEREEQQWQK